MQSAPFVQVSTKYAAVSFTSILRQPISVKHLDPLFSSGGQFIIGMIPVLNPFAFDDILAVLNNSLFDAFQTANRL